MSLQCGIVGLPNVGKSTVFNALTGSSVPANNYPFCTIEPHIGIVGLPDLRLDNLSKIYNSEKTTPSTVEFIDIAGLVKGANRGEGLGNQFLGQIRQTSAILHVVRCFDDESITHIDGDVNPVRDIKTIETELLLTDIMSLEKRLSRAQKASKITSKSNDYELELLEYLINKCLDGIAVRDIPIKSEFSLIKSSLQLLTDKPVLFIANVDEKTILGTEKNGYLSDLIDYAPKSNIIFLCASIEQEISLLKRDERSLFLKEYNLSEPGLSKVIQSSFDILELECFFTCGEKEVRSWTINKGTSAPEAAGVIHSDFRRGFIKADVFNYEDILNHKSEKVLRDLGLINQEGKDYIVKDGDCIYFRFNV